MGNKMNSRKFWIALGTALSGLGTLIGGIVVDNDAITLTLVIVGGVLMAVSTFCYVMGESYIDASSVKSNTLSVTASTTSAATVEKLVSKEEKSLTAD